MGSFHQLSCRVDSKEPIANQISKVVISEEMEHHNVRSVGRRL
jgi:hypothetical protein